MRKPHLACDVDLTKTKYPVMVFPKIDGVRMMRLTDQLTGRSLDTFANLFTTERFSGEIYAGIDGEGACGKETLNSLCRDTTSALNTILGEPDVTWHAFDFLHDSVINMTYAARYNALSTLINVRKPAGVKIIPFVWIDNEKDLLEYYNNCLAQGYEGIVTRDPEALHKDGRATANSGAYGRMKPSSDKEALVISLVEAMENKNEKKQNALGRTERSTHKENLVGKGMVGMLVCKDLTTGATIDVGAGKMTHAERKFFWENPGKIIGQYIRYRSMDSGIKDKPRFARFICIRAKEDMS